MKNPILYISIILSLSFFVAAIPKMILTRFIGHWIDAEYSRNEITFTRSSSLRIDEYGIAFVNASKKTERSSGWCAKPPLIHSDREGTYQRQDCTLVLNPESDYASLFEIKWKIKSPEEKI